jgi:hypothetical protein
MLNRVFVAGRTTHGTVRTAEGSSVLHLGMGICELRWRYLVLRSRYAIYLVCTELFLWIGGLSRNLWQSGQSRQSDEVP